MNLQSSAEVKKCCKLGNIISIYFYSVGSREVEGGNTNTVKFDKQIVNIKNSKNSKICFF